MSNNRNPREIDSRFREEAGQELGFFRDLSEIKALASLKVIWKNVKNQKKS
ncbi:hypothetical protein [Salibacterium salarium]|uniref:hypothetical protein n=1 Tax=Salibacterium salarium TaxID=284579 RepID=UPI00163B568B|nr:hypothetical protein [Salibacterium salarium]